MLCVTPFWTHSNLKEWGDTATADKSYEGDKSLSSEEGMIHQPALEIKKSEGRNRISFLPIPPHHCPYQRSIASLNSNSNIVMPTQLVQTKKPVCGS